MIPRGTVLRDIINSVVMPFSGLPNSAIFIWAPECEKSHLRGPYRKLSCIECEPIFGGYAAYTLWPTGREARVIRYL